MKLTELAIFTDAVQETTAFYERLLASAPVHRGDGITVFQKEGLQILIHRNYVAAEGELPAENHVAFSVADLESAVRSLEATGLQIQYPPRDYAWGRSAYLRDPCGNLVELKNVSKDEDNTKPLGG